jgi:hypothetical protein
VLEGRNELYNNGGAFKLTCRDESGVIVTIIADNYFGYCKKEVKTQISYAANLFGNVRGGTRGRRAGFPELRSRRGIQRRRSRQAAGHTFSRSAREAYGEAMDVKPEGYAVDKKYPEHHLRARGRAF